MLENIPFKRNISLCKRYGENVLLQLHQVLQQHSLKVVVQHAVYSEFPFQS